MKFQWNLFLSLPVSKEEYEGKVIRTFIFIFFTILFNGRVK